MSKRAKVTDFSFRTGTRKFLFFLAFRQISDLNQIVFFHLYFTSYKDGFNKNRIVLEVPLHFFGLSGSTIIALALYQSSYDYHSIWFCLVEKVFQTLSDTKSSNKSTLEALQARGLLSLF